MSSDSDDSNVGQDRLDEFAEEVKRLKVTGGLANPERTGTIIGILLMAVGGFLAVIWSIGKRGDISADGTNNQLGEIIQSTNNTWFVVWALAMIVIGAVIWIRNSITRYLRYWLVRMIYEQRASTDRLVAALTESSTRDADVSRTRTGSSP